jgi:hypothetical protein
MTTLGTIMLGMTTGTPRVEIPRRPRRTIMLATTIPSTAPTAVISRAHDEDKQTLTVYFEELVSGGNKIESVEVVVTSSGQEKKFKLEPLESAKIAGSIFQIKDQELLTLVGASDKDEKGVQARLVAKIDGKEEKLLLIDHHHHH